MEKVDVLVVGASSVVTAEGSTALHGADMRRLKVLQKAAIAVHDGLVTEVGPEDELKKKYVPDNTIDAEGGCITPGLVDPHTHIVFGGSREDEFVMRIEGKTYKEIALAGGGINATVKKTREESEDSLVESAWMRMNNAVSCGTTTIGICSGYGLDVQNELKILRVIATLGEEHAPDVVPIFLGAHDIPPEFAERKEDYIKLIIEEMLPEVTNAKLANFCDVFCEAHTFSIEESRRILTAAKEAGMNITVHADELEATGGAELAVELNATSASHLIKVSDKGVDALAASETVAVLLPGVSFYLKMDYAPARKMIDRGCAVALATDCNPGSSNTENLQVIMTLACLYLGMLPEEVLVATTLNSAAALKLGDRIGTIEKGKSADMVIWREDDYRKIPYHWGVNLVKTVIKSGEVIVQR